MGTGGQSHWKPLDKGTGEHGGRRQVGTGWPEHPPFTVAKTRDLPMSQVAVTKVILMTRVPLGKGTPQEEAK